MILNKVLYKREGKRIYRDTNIQLNQERRGKREGKVDCFLQGFIKINAICNKVKLRGKDSLLCKYGWLFTPCFHTRQQKFTSLIQSLQLTVFRAFKWQPPLNKKGVQLTWLYWPASQNRQSLQNYQEQEVAGITVFYDQAASTLESPWLARKSEFTIRLESTGYCSYKRGPELKRWLLSKSYVTFTIPKPTSLFMVISGKRAKRGYPN